MGIKLSENRQDIREINYRSKFHAFEREGDDEIIDKIITFFSNKISFIKNLSKRERKGKKQF